MVIVTGGAGFIGSVLIWKLNQKGEDKIIIVDSFKNSNSSSQKWKNLSGLRFYDIIDKEDFFDTISKMRYKISAIFHFGAKTSTTESDFGILLKDNYEFSKKIFYLAVEKKARFIYASSAATYGDGSAGFDDNEEKLEKLKPLNPYGFSKHIFDLWMKKNNHLTISLGLKFFNVFGPNEYHKGDMRSFVVKAYEQIKSQGFVKLFKSYHPEIPDGEQKRDFIYVIDAIDITIYLFERGVTGIFNIGTGKAHSFNELVNAVFSALDLHPKIEFIDMPEQIKNQYQYFTQANISKLEKLGYNTQKLQLFKEKIKDYVINFLEKDKKTIGSV